MGCLDGDGSGTCTHVEIFFLGELYTVDQYHDSLQMLALQYLFFLSYHLYSLSIYVTRKALKTSLLMVHWNYSITEINLLLLVDNNIIIIELQKCW